MQLLVPLDTNAMVWKFQFGTTMYKLPSKENCYL